MKTSFSKDLLFKHCPGIFNGCIFCREWNLSIVSHKKFRCHIFICMKTVFLNNGYVKREESRLASSIDSYTWQFHFTRLFYMLAWAYVFFRTLYLNLSVWKRRVFCVTGVLYFYCTFEVTFSIKERHRERQCIVYAKLWRTVREADK